MVTPGQLKRRAELYHQLGASIAAGLSLIKALQMASTNRSLHSSQKTILRLIEFLQEGHTLSDSLQLVQGRSPGMEISLHQSGVKSLSIPEFDVAMLSVGEETGRLDLIFKQLAEYYATKAQIIRDTISGLIVTVMTLNVFLLVFPLRYLTSFVIGIMNNDYSQCAPFIIEKIIAFGSLYGTIFFFIFACQGTRGESWRLMVESITQCIPMLRTAIKYLALSRLAASLESLTNAGVPVMKSWDLAARTSGSPHLGRQIQAWLPQLESGLTPADMTTQIRYFPEMFANLYRTGEISGKIDETLIRLRDYYQEEGFRTLRLFTRIMNGTIYGLLVLLVAYNVISFYMHLYGGMLQNF
jgi:type II secretory pathway component PulF